MLKYWDPSTKIYKTLTKNVQKRDTKCAGQAITLIADYVITVGYYNNYNYTVTRQVMEFAIMTSFPINLISNYYFIMFIL